MNLAQVCYGEVKVRSKKSNNPEFAGMKANFADIFKMKNYNRRR
jgi:hypothetical protein